MASGTWNQGRLKKYVTKIDLENYPTIQFRDNSLTSQEIFNIVEFPTRLTAGKNLIKIRANTDLLVKNSKIHIEILDFNGDPIYYEPLNYLEHDGTRVIAIHVFSETTAPGVGTVYIAGRIKSDLNNGSNIPFSQDFNSNNYLNFPNVLWSRGISIAPEDSKNNTEIIFTRPHPKATVRERINRYFQPTNLSNVLVSRSGSGAVIIKPIPSTTPFNRIQSTLAVNYEGAATPRTVARQFGTMVSLAPTVDTRTVTGTPQEVSSTPINTVSTFCRLETSGFALSSSMQGGTLTIVNPFLEIQPGTSIDVNGQVIPSSQLGEATSTATGLIQLSGSYKFGINNLLSTTKANVFQLSGFKNDNDNTLAAFNVNVVNSESPYNINRIESSTNFTCSYVEPFVISETEQSQSFAEVVLSNIEPATGDVHKVQTLYKPAGQFGDFIDAGTVEVEQVEILEDITTYESIPSIGMIYNRIGYFTSLADYNTYWENSSEVTAPVAITSTYNPELLLDGIQLTPNSNFELLENNYGFIHLKSNYHSKVYANTRYILSLNAVADNSSTNSNDPNIPNARIDIYISGSATNIQPDSEYINRNQISDIDIESTLTGDLISNGKYGTRVSTIELSDGEAYDQSPAIAFFTALKEEFIDVYFIIRSGKWTLSNVSLKSNRQTGFSPNFTRINTRIPSEFLETPLTFKFLYFDIHSNKAQAETVVHPVTFNGDNLVIAGDNNLLSGSVFIGNTIGSGIELAGVNSGFIRSIGYEGFESASRTDQPGGFMLYTGSVLPNAPDNYSGVGIEIVQDSSSFFKFDTTNGIDVRAKKFFIGTDATQFISGSGGNIEISSSLFHLDPANDKLIIGAGTIINADLSANSLFVPAGTDADDATAFMASNGNAGFVGDGSGNYIADFTSGGAKISGFEISSSEIKDSNANLRLKSSGQITGSRVKFTGGDIGGWNINENAIFSNAQGPDRLYITTDAKSEISNANHEAKSVISMYNTSSLVMVNMGNIYKNKTNTGFAVFDNWTSNSKIFEVSANDSDGTLTAQIAGWTFDTTKLQGDQMIIRSNGTIESAEFQSNVPGSGFRLTAASGGFLEVENARIRGTLSTAVFEKETVNAVGGQLYVANSTTLTGSQANPGAFYAPSDTTMSVVNSSGFTEGEILSAKKVNSTGFQTEYLKVNSASRDNASSDTDFSGKIYVTRAYGSGTSGDSGSLGNTPGGAQTYTGSQVIVSTGKIGTGYIRLNANPNDQATPYMQIVERTGSGIYDLDLKAQLGDLSGITDNINGKDVTGFGLYTDNAFLKGGIVATYGAIGALNIGSQSISIGNNRFNDTNTPFFVTASGKFSLGDALTWDGNGLSVSGQITIGAGSTDESGIADAAEAAALAAQSTANTATGSASDAQATANTATGSAADAQATADANALTAFGQWTTASLEQLKTSGDLNGGTVPDDRGMFTTPSYWTNGPLVQIFDTGPISNGWTTSQTDYSAIPNSDTFTFTSTEAVSGSIRVIANDAENGARLIVNSSSGYVAPQLIMHDDFTELNPHGRSAPVFVNQSGSNGIDIHTGSNWALSANITNFGDTSGGSDTGEKTDAMWEYRIPILSGSNVIKMFSPTGDGGHVRRLSVFKDGTIGQLGIDTAQSASNSAAVQAGAASASAAIGIVDAAAASASAAIGIVDAAAASASAATAQSASNAATVMVGAASSSAALAIFSASSAQTAIDDIVKQVVLSNDSIHISSSGQSPDFGLAKFGTTTEFYDGTSAQNVKLQLNTVGVKSLFDADNYSLMFNQGLQVVSASSQVALFGQDTIVGRVAANKSNVQIKDGKVKLRTNTVTKLELDTTGAISASGFAINAAGALTASNADFDGFAIARSLRQKAVVINQSNMHEYLVQVIRTDESDAEVDAGDVDFVVSTTSRLVLDGSLGGEVISHVIFDLDLSIIDPNSGFVQNGFLICMANGTVPTSTYNSVSIAANGTTSTATIAPNANNAGAFGPIREIVSPPTTGNAKVPVTIEIKDGANVEFYVPIGPAATSSAFGNLQTRIDAIQLAANTFVGVKATGE